jgi:FKBP-type peptidyl-prolyl cis-trans isomerase FklB
MKRVCLSLLVAATLSSPLLAQAPAIPKDAPQSPKDKASYAIGLNIGQNLAGQGLKEHINALMIARGLVDALTGAKPALTEAEGMTAMQQLEQTMQQAMAQAGEQAKKDGTAFLAANSKKADVKVLPSGLQYRVIKAGAGTSPLDTSTVKVHYHGTFIDGTVFDSSVNRGEPVEFPVNGVIKGWTEALKLMKPGDKWQLFIPSDLAYGAPGRPGIPANSVLVFEVELLEVK